jgi:hypothetical protein
MHVVKQIMEMHGLDFRGIFVYPGHFLVNVDERERLLGLENDKLQR